MGWQVIVDIVKREDGTAVLQITDADQTVYQVVAPLVVTAPVQEEHATPVEGV